MFKWSFRHLKVRCAACERSGKPMNKEHLFPEWLIERTGTDETAIRWGERRVPAKAATIPLCIDCNDDFGEHLEGPVRLLFDDIEGGRGLSDDEAELLVRWMWKIQGLGWLMLHPGALKGADKYTDKYTLRERVLLPIDAIRERLVLAVSLIAEEHPDFNDRPMGLDAMPEHDAVFVSGVFSMIAIMVVRQPFEALIPAQFGQYRLAPRRDIAHTGKFFFPPTGFRNGVEAVGVTALASRRLSVEHDRAALKARAAL